jgi:2-polyprenyl-3-methyl-5-hydroxy-6-metoxy-1,4-benzoquinol methylase
MPFFDKVANLSRNPAALGDVARRILEQADLHLSSEQTLLDFGCGTGALTNALAPAVRHIHAIDTSPGMIDVAKAQAANGHVNNVEFGHADVFDEQFTEGAFDVVLAFNVLHYIADMPPLLGRIRGLVKPGGLFISSTACLGERPSVLASLTSVLGRVGLIPRMRKYGVGQLERLIADGGFDIVEAQTLSKLPERFVVAKKAV